MKRSTLYIVVIVLLILSGIFGYYIGKNEPSIPLVSRPTKVDSVAHVITPKPIPADNVVAPTTRTVGQADTSNRKKQERSKIVVGVVRRGEVLDINTIDPRGITMLETFAIPSDIPFQIDSVGTVGVDPKSEKKARRRITWAKVGRAAVLVGVGVAGIFLGSKL